MSDFMYTRANQTGIAIVIAGGNEGNTGHHYYGTISPKVGYDTVELKVGEGESGFTMELWGSLPGTYSIDISSPNGEYIPRILPKLQESRNITFVFEKTNIQVDYFVIEAETGDQLILLRFKEPTPGIWKFKVYAGKISSGFHIWLPMRGFITENTAFVKPDNYTTITGPAYSLIPIAVTAYNHKEQKIYPNSGNGYSRINLIKPDLAAPGENVYSPLLNNQFGEKSGTSVAAALTTGAAAMLLEWGIVKKNYPTMNCTQVKKLLIRGVHRNENLTYPNREWGYGTLNIYSTFDNLRGES
jgi:subtilisin family serine protease